MQINPNYPASKPYLENKKNYITHKTTILCI